MLTYWARVMRGLVLACARVGNGLTSSVAGQVAARRALTLLLGRSPAVDEDWDIYRGENGKPRFRLSGVSLEVPALAITHAGDLAIAAVAENSRVGLDLEWRRPRAPSARRRLAALIGEAGVLGPTPFEVAWTIHEAMFKATAQAFVASQPRVIDVTAECPSTLCGWWSAARFINPLTFVNPLWVMTIVALPFKISCAFDECAVSDRLLEESYGNHGRVSCGMRAVNFQATIRPPRFAENDTSSQSDRGSGLVTIRSCNAEV